MQPARAPADDAQPRHDAAAIRRFAWSLFALALLSRLIWVLWVHPPGEHIFSDMARYLERARALAEHGPAWADASGTGPHMRAWAWQAWGTHALMGAVLKVGGSAAPYTVLTLVWAALWAAVVPMTYLLATRVLGPQSQGLAKAAGWAALLWVPHLTLSGYFLSEAPFTLALLVSTWGLARLWSEGRGVGLVALALSCTLALRPQVILFVLPAALAYLGFVWRARQGKGKGEGQGNGDSSQVHVRVVHVLLIGAALLCTLSFSMWRFSQHTGYVGGVAENANMNLTAARCHNVVTQAFRSPQELERSKLRDSTLDGRRVSLPGFRLLATSGEHPLALRPSLGGESIKFVGYVGDPDLHREIRARCYAQDGWFEQGRKSLVNLSLLWVLNYQWPEVGDRKAAMWYRMLSQFVGWVFVVVVLVPSLVGWGRALRRGSANPAALLCALQMGSLFVLAVVFFGTIRLRTPYDPYALILALPVLQGLYERLRGRAAPNRA